MLRRMPGQGKGPAAVLMFTAGEAESQQGWILHPGGIQMVEGIIKQVKEKSG